MPFYEYQCKNCGHDLEAMQKISEPPLRKCPHCGKSQLQRLMSAPVFRLKGGGWYETDFKGDSDNKKNLADRPDADAPKDAAKDTAKDAGAAAGAEAKGTDGKTGDAKATEGTAAKDAPAAKDKAADKPSDKAAAGKKLDLGKGSAGGRRASRSRSPAKRPVKRPAPKVKRGR
ncbi:MAG: zinc ribbon domain-containing protein [Gammaproteobacteria bacterium]